MAEIIAMNITEYMGPDTDKINTYVHAVAAGLDAGRDLGALTDTCPECGSNFGDLDEAYGADDHILILTTSDTPIVVVACEGYFVVNPNLVGFDAPNWQDWSTDTTGGTLPQGVQVEMLLDNCPGTPHRGHTNPDVDCPLH